MLTGLTLAALAKWAALRVGVGRFLNGNAGIAVAIAVVVIAVIGGLWWLRYDAASNAVAGRDATWRATIADERAKQLIDQRHRDLLAEERAADERRRIEAERDAATETAVELERKLTTLEQQDNGDPVVFPRDLVRSLRK